MGIGNSAHPDRETCQHHYTALHSTTHHRTTQHKDTKMRMSVARITIEGLGPLSQSHRHEEPKLEGESHEDYDIRTWRSKLNVSRKTGTIIIPAFGMQTCVVSAARRAGERIPGRGMKTWKGVFEGGIALFDDFDTGIKPEDAEMVTISANADGIRGSGKRVTRRFPTLYDWTATGEIYALDQSITAEVMRRYVEQAGLFIGVGQFRPENGGTNGRFRIKSFEWEDNRSFAA